MILSRFRRLLGRSDNSSPELTTIRGAADTGPAIVFLHGFTGDPMKTWGEFPGLLAEEPTLSNWNIFSFGYTTSLRLDVPFWSTNQPGLDVLTTGLGTALRIPPLSSCGSIAIVAHSMGGLIAQRAVLDHNDDHRIGHLIMFCTPSLGVRQAVLGRLFSDQVRDLTPKSAFIRGLRRDWSERFADGLPFVLRIVAGEGDTFVPPDSCLSPFGERYRATVSGNHIQAVKPVDSHSRNVQIVVDALCGRELARTVVDTARLAVELRDFRAAVATLRPMASKLDNDALVQLALALDSLGRRSEALQVLEERNRVGRLSVDAMGALAGRIKRRWLTERREEDWRRARELYTEGLRLAREAGDHAQVFYHAINVGFLELMGTPPSSAVPASAAEAAHEAIEAAERSERDDHWRRATVADGMSMLGDFDGACEWYRLALDLRPKHRERDSIYEHAIRIASRVHSADEAQRIEAIFGTGV